MTIKLVGYVAQRVTSKQVANAEAAAAEFEKIAQEFRDGKPGRTAVIHADRVEFFFSTGHPAGGCFIHTDKPAEPAAAPPAEDGGSAVFH